MPRNGLGNYALPFTQFSPDTTISIAAVNGDLDDIALAITQSVAADGQSQMTGPFKMNSGAASGPSITFAASLSDGFFLNALNQIGLAIGGALTFLFTAAGISSGVGVSPIPQAGTMMDFAGASAPPGWLLCGGQAVSRLTYAALFSVIGTTFGSGDGSSTFNLPDCRGRATFGIDNMGGTPANRITVAGGNFDGTQLGNSGGLQNHSLIQNEIPSHTHTTSISDPQHTHTSNIAFASPTVGVAGNGTFIPSTPITINNNTTGITVQNANAGSSSPYPNLNPALMLNKIINTGGV